MVRSLGTPTVVASARSLEVCVTGHSSTNGNTKAVVVAVGRTYVARSVRHVATKVYVGGQDKENDASEAGIIKRLVA